MPRTTEEMPERDEPDDTIDPCGGDECNCPRYLHDDNGSCRGCGDCTGFVTP